MDAVELRKLIPELDTQLIEEIVDKSQYIEVQGETQLLDIGSRVRSVPLVVKGLIKVSRRDEDKELLLYHIYPGEICIMSFSACCSQTESLILASTIEPTSLLLLPADVLRRWLFEHPTLNGYVYRLYHNRYMDLIDTIDQLIFFNLDERLLHYLEEKSGNKGNLLLLTHQQIANDLGTAREVVSRIMKKLEKDGRIEQGRNQVRLLE